MKRLIWHLLGCAVPLLVIFLFPLLGLGQGITLFVFIVLMFACHLFMMRGHGHENGDHPDRASRTGEAHCH